MASRLLKPGHALRAGLFQNPSPAVLSYGSSNSFAPTASVFKRSIHKGRGSDQSRSISTETYFPPPHEYLPYPYRNTSPALPGRRIDVVSNTGPAIKLPPQAPVDLSTRPEVIPEASDEPRYWTHVPQWADITPSEFISNTFQVTIPHDSYRNNAKLIQYSDQEYRQIC